MCKIAGCFFRAIADDDDHYSDDDNDHNDNAMVMTIMAMMTAEKFDCCGQV